MTDPTYAKSTGRARRPAKSQMSPGRPPRPKESRAPAAQSVAAAAEDVTPPINAGRKSSKLDAVISLLRRPDGVTLDEIVAATGWQRHSARGALAGAVKKTLGAGVVPERVEGVLRYRAPEAGQ